MLKLGPYKTTVIHALQPAQNCESAYKVKIVPVEINVLEFRFGLEKQTFDKVINDHKQISRNKEPKREARAPQM